MSVIQGWLSAIVRRRWPIPPWSGVRWAWRRGSRTCSRMIGLTLEGRWSCPSRVTGTSSAGAPGPMLIYRLSDDDVRAVIDIPLDHSPHNWKDLLSESYARWMPESLRSAFIEAWSEERFHAAANVVSPRLTYGTSRRVLIGDAAGHYHPLTATGITLGFGDAYALAESEEFGDFRNGRFEATRVPELLAMGLYEVFADPRAEGAALRQAMYSRWRASSGVRGRTMRLLGCDDTSIRSLSWEFSTTVLWALKATVPTSLNRLAWRRYRDVARGLSNRLGWLLRAAWHLYNVRRAGGTDAERPTEALARAFLTSMPSGVVRFATGRRASPDGGRFARCWSSATASHCAPTQPSGRGRRVGRRNGLVPDDHGAVGTAAAHYRSADRARAASPLATLLRAIAVAGGTVGPA